MPGTDQAILMVEDSRGARTYVLTTEVSTLGRSGDNTIQVIGDYVSRNHATFRRIEEKNQVFYQVSDGETGGNTPSTNGIYVNGRRVTTHTLVSGDVIHFGPHVHATFVLLESDAEPSGTLKSTAVFLDRPEDIIAVVPLTTETTGHQMIPTVDWYLADYFPVDLIELIAIGHFNHMLSAINLKTAIYEQCLMADGTIDPQWQPVLDALAQLKQRSEGNP